MVVFAGAPPSRPAPAIAGPSTAVLRQGPWFTSSNARTKAAPARSGVVRRRQPWWASFRLLGQSNQRSGVVRRAAADNIWRTFTSGMPSGRVFFNSFKQTSSACQQHDYNFTGTEFY